MEECQPSTCQAATGIPVRLQIIRALLTMVGCILATTWREIASVIGVASGALASWFDRSRDAPERATERVEFVLPSFLLIDANGQVVRRAWGPGTGFRPALDSLLQAMPVSTRAPVRTSPPRSLSSD